MSDHATPGTPEQRKERAELLHAIWMAQTRAVLAILENTEPTDLSANMVQACTRFLATQGVDFDSLEREISVGGSGPEYELEKMLAELKAEDDQEIEAADDAATGQPAPDLEGGTLA